MVIVTCVSEHLFLMSAGHLGVGWSRICSTCLSSLLDLPGKLAEACSSYKNVRDRRSRKTKDLLKPGLKRSQCHFCLILVATVNHVAENKVTEQGMGTRFHPFSGRDCKVTWQRVQIGGGASIGASNVILHKY